MEVVGHDDRQRQAAAFRAWLRARYGSLDSLHEAWGTAFWSQHYSSWDQVLPPRATQYLPNPGQSLDFRRFWSDELLACYVEQRDVLRSHTPDVPVTTNFMGPENLVMDPWSWGRLWTGRLWTGRLRTEGATVLASYDSGDLAACPR